MVYTTDWTLESGPEEAPNVLECSIDYTYSFGSPDSWMAPGDPPECEIDAVFATNEFGEEVTLSLVLVGEQGFLEYMYENPPEPDYGPDDY